MTTAVIIAVVVVAIIAIALVVLPRMRGRQRERELVARRGEVADAHRQHAADRSARAEEAELMAAKERAEAELHETRARLHERGLADEQLDADRDRLARTGDARTAPADDDRFAREEDATVAPEERR